MTDKRTGLKGDARRLLEAASNGILRLRDRDDGHARYLVTQPVEFGADRDAYITAAAAVEELPGVEVEASDLASEQPEMRLIVSTVDPEATETALVQIVAALAEVVHGVP